MREEVVPVNPHGLFPDLPSHFWQAPGELEGESGFGGEREGVLAKVSARRKG